MLPMRREDNRVVEIALGDYGYVEGCKTVVLRTEGGVEYRGIISRVGEASDYRVHFPDGDVEDLYDPNTEATSGEDLSDK